MRNDRQTDTQTHTKTGLCYYNIDSCRGTIACFMESLKVMIAVNVRFTNGYIFPSGVFPTKFDVVKCREIRLSFDKKIYLATLYEPWIRCKV